jgi:hypothetical protein
MDWIETISEQLKSDEELFNETGEIVCPSCNGTGINPDYKEVNVILRAIDELPDPCRTSSEQMEYRSQTTVPNCLTCYGLKKIDWVQYARGTYKQELIDLKKDIRHWFLSDIEDFLSYVHGGQVFSGIFSEGKYLHFDLESKSWTEVGGRRNDINSLRDAWKWLNRFRADDYFDLETLTDALRHYQELYLVEPEQHFWAIKAELLYSKELTMERLIEIKNDLALFWWDMERLTDLGTGYRPYGILPMVFEFTWEKVLKQFGLPLDQLAFLNSAEIEHKKQAWHHGFVGVHPRISRKAQH